MRAEDRARSMPGFRLHAVCRFREHTGQRARSAHHQPAPKKKGDLRFMLTKKAVTAPVFVEFLTRLLRGMKRPVFLILDGHPVHRSGKVQEFVASTNGRLQLFFLPPYSPELNPDEQVWAEVKAKGIGRRVITSARQMFSTLLGLLRSLQRTPRKVRAFFEHPETRYTIATG